MYAVWCFCQKKSISFLIVRKTCPCNVHVYPPGYTPMNPTFILQNWGMQGYTFFLMFFQNKDCGYSLEPPHRGDSNVYPQSII